MKAVKPSGEFLIVMTATEMSAGAEEMGEGCEL